MKSKLLFISTAFAICGTMNISAQSTNAQIILHADKAEKNVSPTLYGLMTEEINYSYEGGLYAQLLRNPSFEETTVMAKPFHARPNQPKYWLLTDTISEKMCIENTDGINSNVRTYLRLVTTKSDGGIENNGFWGFPIKSDAVFNGSFYASALKGGNSVKVTLESADGKTIYAQTLVSGISNVWQKFDYKLNIPSKVQETSNVKIRFSFPLPGDYRITRAILFPSTYKNRKNGLRVDLMTMMKSMSPKFLRFPGGNYVEGNRFADRFDWKKTIGDVDSRPGHNSPWGYRSTDGMGLLEFLEWAEDVGAEPILAVFAGYTLNGDHVTGEALKPYIQDALDEIEYVIGDAETKWGAQRIRDGHSEPFPLHYVEIGNEDYFDVSGSYAERYSAFYDAIKERYPQLQLISTTDKEFIKHDAIDINKIKIDIQDDHYYRDAEEMYRQAYQYDSYKRGGTKIFVGEWATREGEPTTNMNAALGDAVWMTCMERNSDLIIGHCYAPLFVNVNPGGMQWKSDLIGYNTLYAYGSPSYYAQVMFSNNLGNKIIPTEMVNIPKFRLKLRGNQKIGDEAQQLYCSATKDSISGRIYLKIVNVTGNANKVNIQIDGVDKLPKKASIISLHADKPEDTNSIDAPTNIVPVKKNIKMSNNFDVELLPYELLVILI